MTSRRTRCQQVELVEPQAIGDALEVVDEGLERQIGRVPVRQPVAALVIPDQRPAGAKFLDPVPPQRAVPIIFQMVEPIGGLDQRRALAGDRECELGAVGRRAMADLLGRQVGSLHAASARLLFRFDLPPPRRRRLAELALERAVERRLAVEADRISDVGGVLLAVAQHVGGDPHPPPGAVTHRRFAEQLDEALPKHAARHAGFAREALDVDLLGVAAMDDRQRLGDGWVGEAA
jgi:hypothetical protein